MPTSDEEANRRNLSEELKRQYAENLDAVEAELDSTLTSLATLQRKAASKDIPGLLKSMDELKDLEGKVASLGTTLRLVKPYKLTYEPYRSEIGSRYDQIREQITEVTEELGKEILKESERCNDLQRAEQNSRIEQDAEEMRKEEIKAREEAIMREEKLKEKNEKRDAEKKKKNALLEEVDAKTRELKDLSDKKKIDELMHTQATDHVVLQEELKEICAKIDSILGSALLTEVKESFQNNKYDRLYQASILRRKLNTVQKSYQSIKEYCIKLQSAIEKLQDLEKSTNLSFSHFREAYSTNDLEKLKEEIKVESELLKRIRGSSVKMVLQDLEHLGLQRIQCPPDIVEPPTRPRDIIKRYGEQIEGKISSFLRIQSGLDKIEKELKEIMKILEEKRNTFLPDEKESKTKEVEKIKNEIEDKLTDANDDYLETKWLFDLQVTSLKEVCEEIERNLESVIISPRRGSQFARSMDLVLYLKPEESHLIRERIKKKYPTLAALRKAVTKHKKETEIQKFLINCGLTEEEAQVYLSNLRRHETEKDIVEGMKNFKESLGKQKKHDDMTEEILDKILNELGKVQQNTTEFIKQGDMGEIKDHIEKSISKIDSNLKEINIDQGNLINKVREDLMQKCEEIETKTSPSSNQDFMDILENLSSTVGAVETKIGTLSNEVSEMNTHQIDLLTAFKEMRENDTFKSELEEINKILNQVTEDSESIKEGQEKLRARFEESGTSTSAISSMPSSSNLEEIKEILRSTINDEKDKGSNDEIFDQMKSMQSQIESLLQQGELLLKEHREDNEQMKEFIGNLMKGEYKLPKFVTIVPKAAMRDQKEKISHLLRMTITPSEWGKAKFKMYFHCSKCMKPALCGEKGKGYNLFDSKSLKNILPVARVSALLLKGALGLAGLPSVQFPIGTVDCDYLDKVSQTLLQDKELMEDLEEDIADSIGEVIKKIEEDQKFPDHLTAKMKPITSKCHNTILNLMSQLDPHKERIGLDLVKGGEGQDTSFEWVCSTCTEGFKAEGKQYEVVNVSYGTDATSSTPLVPGA